MSRMLQSALMYVALGALVVLGIIGVAQLDSIEARLIAVEKRLDGGVPVAGASAAAAPARAAGCREDAWWKADAVATAEPGNLLKPHADCLVPDATVARGGTLRRQIGQDPRGLNQYIANGADTTEYARYYSNRLAYRQFAEPDVYSPELAQRVTTEDDGLSYEITLRKGVMWHKPTVDLTDPRHAWLNVDHELTSDDYAFVFDMLAEPQVAGRISSMRTYFDSLDHYEVIDRYTLKLVFKERLHTTLPQILDLEPAPRWLYLYDEDGRKFDDATWGLKLNEHWYNQKAIGVGPYRFVSWEPGVRIEFERAPGYWGEAGSFDKVSLLILKDQNAWVRKLKTGELDYTQLQPEQYKTEILDAKGPYLGSDHIKLGSHPELGYFYIAWNADNPLFSDKRVRRAMTMALDREGIIRNVFHGSGVPVSGPFVPEMYCYDKSIAPLAYDLQTAAKLLDEAGWVDGNGDGVREKTIDGESVPFEFPLMIYGSSTEYETLASVFREALLSIGVRMTPQALEWSTMLKKMDERQFAAYTGAWVMDWEVDLYQIWHSAEADRPMSSNRIGFRNPEADAVIEGLRREFDDGKRADLCHQFHRIVAEEQPYTFIYQRVRPVLYWDYLNPLRYTLITPFRDLRYYSFREARP